MEQDTIRQMVNTHDWEKLTALTDADVGQFLVAVMQDYEHSYPAVDFDRLISLGITFMNSGHGNADIIFLLWLMEAPSTHRLDIVSTLLLGLWKRGSHHEPVSSEKVAMLMKAREGLVLDEQAKYNYALALCEVVNSNASSSLKDKVAKVLERIVQHRFENPGLDKLLKSAVNRALQP